MKLPLSLRYQFLFTSLFLCFFAVPLSARAFSLATLVEAHQERMQLRYERMSYRLCGVVSSLLPFVGTEAWCTGKGVEKTPSSTPDEDVLFPPNEFLILKSLLDTATSSPVSLGATTTTTVDTIETSTSTLLQP